MSSEATVSKAAAKKIEVKAAVKDLNEFLSMVLDEGFVLDSDKNSEVSKALAELQAGGSSLPDENNDSELLNEFLKDDDGNPDKKKVSALAMVILAIPSCKLKYNNVTISEYDLTGVSKVFVSNKALKKAMEDLVNKNGELKKAHDVVFGEKPVEQPTKPDPEKDKEKETEYNMLGLALLIGGIVFTVGGIVLTSLFLANILALQAALIGGIVAGVTGVAAILIGTLAVGLKQEKAPEDPAKPNKSKKISIYENKTIAKQNVRQPLLVNDTKVR
jgi:hypothetical protein